MRDNKRYWVRLRIDGHPWNEVSKENYIDVERGAGFRSKAGPNEIATGIFLVPGIEGYVTKGEITLEKHPPELVAMARNIDLVRSRNDRNVGGHTFKWMPGGNGSLFGPHWQSTEGGEVLIFPPEGNSDWRVLLVEMDAGILSPRKGKVELNTYGGGNGQGYAFKAAAVLVSRK